MDSMYIPSPNYINIFSIVGNRISRMDLTATAVLNLTVYQNKSVIDRIFCLNAVLHNSCQLQSLAKFDKFVFNSDLQFFLLLSPGYFLRQIDLF